MEKSLQTSAFPNESQEMHNLFCYCFIYLLKTEKAILLYKAAKILLLNNNGPISSLPACAQ